MYLFYWATLAKSDEIKPNGSFDEDDYYTIDELKRALSTCINYKFEYYDNHDQLLKYLSNSSNKYDFVLNLCDEGFNNKASNELHVPALLEMLNIAYSGGNPQCLAYCYDKSLVRGLAKEMDIPVPEGFIVHAHDTAFINLPISFPVIAKPNFGDSSFGITKDSVCWRLTELETAITRIHEKFGYYRPVLVEQFLQGKDLSVGILGNPPESYMVLPIIQENYASLPTNLPSICGYEAKWDSSSPYYKISSIPARLDDSTETYLITCCLKLFERLDCRDYARFDWRLDQNGTPRLLEVNPNPGWCWDGHLAKMANLQGITYSKLLQKIINACDDRTSKIKYTKESILTDSNVSAMSQ